MLVILRIFPVSAPFKIMSFKQPEAQIFMINLVREVRFAIQIRLFGDRLYDPFTVHNLSVRVIQRVDIRRQPQTVFRDPCRMRN